MYQGQSPHAEGYITYRDEEIILAKGQGDFELADVTFDIGFDYRHDFGLPPDYFHGGTPPSTAVEVLSVEIKEAKIFSSQEHEGASLNEYGTRPATGVDRRMILEQFWKSIAGSDSLTALMLEEGQVYDPRDVD